MEASELLLIIRNSRKRSDRNRRAQQEKEEQQKQQEELRREQIRKAAEQEEKQKAEKAREEERQRQEAAERMNRIQQGLESLYDASADSVAMNTGKNRKIFQDVQNEMWKLPDSCKSQLEEYQKAIDRISDAWNYKNDQWNYETSTLKVSVELKQTEYTKYWVCHVQTFRPGAALFRSLRRNLRESQKENFGRDG